MAPGLFRAIAAKAHPHPQPDDRATIVYNVSLEERGMVKRFAEQTILFFSVLKWVALATVVGATVGLSTTLFLKTLSWATALTHRYPHYYFLLPLAFFLSALTIRYLAPYAEGHWTEKVIEAVRRARRGRALVAFQRPGEVRRCRPQEVGDMRHQGGIRCCLRHADS